MEKGLIAVALGVAMLLMSFVFSRPGPMGTVAKALQSPAWWALGIGLVLIAIDVLLRRSTTQAPLPKTPAALNRSPRGTSAHTADETVRPRHAPWQPAAPSTLPKRDAAPQWNATVFDAIEWRRFEAVCSALFAQAGFETRTQSHGPDGGVDIWLHSKNASGPVSVVQCKHWRGKQVGVKEVREFFGVMASQGLRRGTYATSSTFTPDAMAFAKSNGIHLLDGAGLLGLIGQRTPDQQQALLAVAFEGDHARPTCASCGEKMVERQPKKGGSPFWGCTNYPRCRGTLPKRA